MKREMDDETLKLYGFVISSAYRKKVLLLLSERPKFPSQIAKEIGYDSNAISTLLGQLKSRGLIELVNPEVRKGRIYRITGLGEEIARNL